MVCNDTSAKGL